MNKIEFSLCIIISLGKNYNMRFYSSDLISAACKPFGAMFTFSHTFGELLTETICFGRFAWKHIFICHRKANGISLTFAPSHHVNVQHWPPSEDGCRHSHGNQFTIWFSPQSQAKTIPLDGWRVKLAK